MQWKMPERAENIMMRSVRRNVKNTRTLPVGGGRGGKHSAHSAPATTLKKGQAGKSKKGHARKWPTDDSFLLRIVCRDSVGKFLEGGAAVKKGRERVQSLLVDNVEQLLSLALQEKDSAVRKWAGEVLAHIVSRIGVEDRKLRETNPSYRDWRSKIGKKFGTVLYPTAIISQIVQCELALSERTREFLMVLDFTDDDWKQEAKRLGVSESYWPLKDLEKFSQKSEPQWWKIIWGHIKENYPDWLKALKAESVAAEKRSSKFHQRFRQHFQLLARRRDKGVETR